MPDTYCGGVELDVTRGVVLVFGGFLFFKKVFCFLLSVPCIRPMKTERRVCTVNVFLLLFISGAFLSSDSYK